MRLVQSSVNDNTQKKFVCKLFISLFLDNSWKTNAFRSKQRHIQWKTSHQQRLSQHSIFPTTIICIQARKKTFNCQQKKILSVFRVIYTNRSKNKYIEARTPHKNASSNRSNASKWIHHALPLRHLCELTFSFTVACEWQKEPGKNSKVKTQQHLQ